MGAERGGHSGPTDRLVDTARRIVLAKAVNPHRLCVPAPFELTTTDGAAAWQPTDEYIPLRTLFHHLYGRPAVASLALEHDAVVVLFGGRDRHALVLWTWRRDTDDLWTRLCVGAAASALELSGAPRSLEREGPWARVPLSTMPLIIENVTAPLLLLQDSLGIAPGYIQLHNPEPRRVLTLRNHYETELVGRIELHPPPNWKVSPSPIHLRLAPGAALRETLDFTIPPRQIASRQQLGVDVRLTRPDSLDLHFDVGLDVELRDIVVKATAWWDGNDLVVEQTLRNLSPQPVSFNAFCQAHNRAQFEGVFLNVPPGNLKTHEYRLPAARALAGSKLWIGIQEIDGPRTLDQLVPVPRQASVNRGLRGSAGVFPAASTAIQAGETPALPID